MTSLWHHYYDIITVTSLLWHCYYDIITMTSLYSITFHYVLIQFFIAYSMNKNGRGGWPMDKANQWVVRAIVNISTLFQTRSNEKQDLVTSLLGTRTKNESLPSYNCTPLYSTQPRHEWSGYNCVPTPLYMSITSTVRRSDMASPTVCIGNRITRRLHTHTKEGAGMAGIQQNGGPFLKPVFDNGFFTWFISCVSAYSWLAASRAAADSLKQKEKHKHNTQTSHMQVPFTSSLLFLPSHLSSSEAFWKVSVALWLKRTVPWPLDSKYTPTSNSSALWWRCLTPVEVQATWTCWNTGVCGGCDK